MMRLSLWCVFLGVVCLVAVRVAGTGLAAPFAVAVVAAAVGLNRATGTTR